MTTRQAKKIMKPAGGGQDKQTLALLVSSLHPHDMGQYAR